MVTLFCASGSILSKSNITVRNNRNEIAAFTLSSHVDGKYELSIPSINANRLSRTYTVSLKGVSFTYGPYNYCYYAIGATEAEFTNTVKTLSRAIFNYSQAAKAYFGD